MKFLRISLHSFIMVIANLVAIYCGFIVYYLLKPANQIAVQLPVAVILSIVGFALWNLFLRIKLLKRFAIREKKELIFIYFAGFVWVPVIFVPLHYITQGYLTSYGNIVAIWLFQLPLNFISIAFLFFFTRRKRS